MVEKSKLDEDREGKAVDLGVSIGTLLYLTASRPDLQFAICMCAWYQARPTEKHMRIMLAAKILAEVHLEVCNFWDRGLLAGHQRGKRVLLFPVRKLNTSPYLDVMLKSYGCDHNFRTMALDLTKFQCTATIKVLLPYAAIMSNTLGLNTSTSDIISSKSRTMATTIEKQLAMDEALVPITQRDMLHISPRIPGQSFVELPLEEEILEFIRNIDYAFLIWEDFVYQIAHKNHKKSNEMYYPRFTKVTIHHFMSKDSSIPRRNKYSAMLPIELTNDEIRNTKAYKEYYAFATGEAVPKP
nr:hypothetical protein [Tanacetum cinerariifolium]